MLGQVQAGEGTEPLGKEVGIPCSWPPSAHREDPSAGWAHGKPVSLWHAIRLTGQPGDQEPTRVSGDSAKREEGTEGESDLQADPRPLAVRHLLSWGGQDVRPAPHPRRAERFGAELSGGRPCAGIESPDAGSHTVTEAEPGVVTKQPTGNK